MRKIFASVLALTLLMPTQALANEDFSDLEFPAGQVDLSTLPVEFQEKLSKRTKEVNDYLENLEELRIQKELASNELLKGIATTHSLARFNDISTKLEYYENNSLEIVGLKKIVNDNQNLLIQPLSTSKQASVKAPTLYYDNDVASYVLSSGWNWLSINGDRNNKGDDGFGLRVNQEMVSVISDHVTTWDNYGNKYFPLYNSITSKHGYYQEFEDMHMNGIGRGYSAHTGNSWMFFRFYNGTPLGKTVNFNGQYAHNWEGSNLTGLSVGATGFGGSFSILSKGWMVNNYSFKTF
ncbi:hypothetical protein [Sporosarcina sp. FSL K6-2383]|uniref:hypothetical protein n=1 Tax=Sporosarcina sp. FSL K6-2383 TaxID=2921556 RepID=UPI003159C01B